MMRAAKGERGPTAMVAVHSAAVKKSRGVSFQLANSPRKLGKLEAYPTFLHSDYGLPRMLGTALLLPICDEDTELAGCTRLGYRIA
jgi:hypothetical protein